jgi:hypothetical protein
MREGSNPTEPATSLSLCACGCGGEGSVVVVAACVSPPRPLEERLSMVLLGSQAPTSELTSLRGKRSGSSDSSLSE